MSSRDAGGTEVLATGSGQQPSAGALALQRSVEVVEQVMNGAIVKTGAIPTDSEALVELRQDYVS